MAYCVWKRGPNYWNSWISGEQSALQISPQEAYRHVLRPHKENDATITFCSRSYHEHHTSHCLLKSAHAWHVKWRLIIMHFVARNCANRNWTETVDHFGRSALCNLLCFFIDDIGSHLSKKSHWVIFIDTSFPLVVQHIFVLEFHEKKQYFSCYFTVVILSSHDFDGRNPDNASRVNSRHNAKIRVSSKFKWELPFDNGDRTPL